VLHFVVSYGLLLLACGYAVFRGDWPERTVAIMVLLGVMATALAYYLGKNAYTHLDTAMFLIDLICLAVLIWITLKADRFWTIPFTALHLIGLSGHILRLAEADIYPVIYKILVGAPIYPMLLLLTWGTRRAVTRRGARRQRSFRGYFPSMASLMRRASRGF